MPTIRRDDGAQFVIQSYREILNAKKKSALKREMRLLAKHHGEHVAVFKQANNQLEAALAREPGFLLGEAIWFHFGKPDDLIYCEATADKQHALIVIVKSGSVYLDAKIALTDLYNELLTVATGDHHYNIYVYGDIPLVEKQEIKKEGVFNFEEANIAKFQRLEKSIFLALPLDTEYQLRPLELALTSTDFNQPIFLPLVTISIILFAVIFLGHLYNSATTIKELTTNAAISPYVTYNNALTTPTPRDQIKEMISLLSSMFSLPAWEVTSINLENNQYEIKLKASGGDASQLEAWTKLHHLRSQINGDIATLQIATNTINRLPPKYIYNIDQTLAKLLKNIGIIIAKEDISIAQINTDGTVKSVILTLKFHDLSPTLLDLISKIFIDYPLQLNKITIDMQNHLLSGSINLTLWGN
jgi:hypothetical protein